MCWLLVVPSSLTWYTCCRVVLNCKLLLDLNALPSPLSQCCTSFVSIRMRKRNVHIVSLAVVFLRFAFAEDGGDDVSDAFIAVSLAIV